MDINSRIDSITTKAELFGISSSEDIYWFITGYYFAENNYSANSSASSLINKLTYYIDTKIRGTDSVMNWGGFIKSISSNDMHSITLFREFYLASLNISPPIKKNKKNTVLYSEVSGNKFEGSIKFIGQHVNTTIQLYLFILGYEMACIDNKVEKDSSFNFYKNNQHLLNTKILTKLDLTLHSNWGLQLFVAFYPKPHDGVVYFINQLLLFLKQSR